MSLPSTKRPLLVGLAVEPIHQEVSPAGRRALVRAVQLAERTGARMELIHAVPGDVFVESEEADQVRFAYHLSKAGRNALLAAQHEVWDKGHPANLLFRPERPAQALADRARAVDAGLILIGAFEASPSGLGSIARRLLDIAPCPVWTVHLEEPARIGKVRIEAGTDGRTVQLGESFARLIGAEVVHEGAVELVVGRGGEAAAAGCSSLIMEPGHRRALGGVG